jgi:hypothetical protein
MGASFGYQLFNKRTEKIIANVIPQVISNASLTGSAFNEQYPDCFL